MAYASATNESEMPEQPRVFVIDDDSHVRSSLKFLLESAGLVVETFPSAKTFLQRAGLHGASCVVLDLRMPKLDGLDVQERLAQSGIRIPIVFLSGHADVPSTAQAMRDGAVDFLVKPVDDAQLLDAVRRALTRDEHTSSSARTNRIGGANCTIDRAGTRGDRFGRKRPAQQASCVRAGDQRADRKGPPWPCDAQAGDRFATLARASARPRLVKHRG